MTEETFVMVHQDAYKVILFQSDGIPLRSKEVKMIEVWNSRNAPALNLLTHRGMDYLRVNKGRETKRSEEYIPHRGELVFITIDDTMARAEAESRLKIAEGTDQEFKGTAVERQEVVDKLIARFKKQDKPVLVEFEGQDLG